MPFEEAIVVKIVGCCLIRVDVGLSGGVLVCDVSVSQCKCIGFSPLVHWPLGIGRQVGEAIRI